MENIERIKKTLLNSIFEVFEKVFFVFLECSERKRSDYRWVASIKFYGAKEGELRAYFTEGLVDPMVQNMLNLTCSEITDKLRQDCIKETINVIGGTFLRNLDSSHVFDLSLPTVESCTFDSTSDKDNRENKLSVSLEANNEMVTVVLTFGRGS